MAKSIRYSPASIVILPNVFGSGSDGNLIVSGTTTLVVNSNYRNITVNAGGTLNCNGARLFVQNRLLNNGTITNAGNNASGISAGAAVTGYAFQGGNGGAAGRNTVGTGANPLAIPFVFNDASMYGGDGGNATGGPGGAGFQVTTTTGGEDIGNSLNNIVSILAAGVLFQGVMYRLCGGGGGAAGGVGTAAVGSSGGGGSGGGTIFIAARTFINNGTVTVRGGNGGNASGTGNIGGGGSGGGGLIAIVSNNLLLGTTSIAPGTGGTGVGSGTAGSPGQQGLLLTATGN